jgi:hypothetical protein
MLVPVVSYFLVRSNNILVACLINTLHIILHSLPLTPYMFCVLRTIFLILDAQYSMLDTRYSMLNAQCSMLNALSTTHYLLKSPLLNNYPDNDWRPKKCTNRIDRQGIGWDLGNDITG